MAQFFNFIIDGGVLGNVGVRAGNVSLWLVIIIVADKIFHRIFREKLLKFAVKLSGQSFVVGDYQSRPLGAGNYIGHGKGFAAAGYAQQCLVSLTCRQASAESVHRLGLVARQLVITMQFKFHRLRLLCVIILLIF